MAFACVIEAVKRLSESMGKHTMVSSSRSSKMGSGVPASMQLMRMRETPLPQPSMMPSERRAATRLGLLGRDVWRPRSAPTVQVRGGRPTMSMQRRSVNTRVEHGFVHRILRRSTMATGGAETVGAARGRLLFR